MCMTERDVQRAMKKENVSKKMSRNVVAALNSVLKAEANSASCWIFYQPKAPDKLSQFKRRK